MKKAKPVALIEGGNLGSSPLARFRWPSETLGPVKASSFRLASRIANRLQAGYPAKDYQEFDACTLILICVPDATLPSVLVELSAAEICWKRKALVLCSAWLDSSELGHFAARGAAVGSLSPIPGLDDVRYLLEGDKLAVLEAKRLVENRRAPAIAIERGLKPFYLAALTCTGPAAFALAAAASECLRHAGVAPLDSAAILEKQLRKTLHSYLRAGRRNYQPPRELSGQLTALASRDTALAAYLDQSCRLADRLLGEREEARAAVAVRG
jgi:hypothetical protein